MLRKIRLKNEQGKELLLIIGEKEIDKIINLLYPPEIQGNSKGYIGLVNFFYKDNEAIRDT